MEQDTDLNPVLDQEREREQADEELARKIRREVRRINSGQADEDYQRDDEAEREQMREQAQERLRERRKRSNWLWLIVSGVILVRSGVSQYYRYAICIAVMFLLSIASIFNALRLDKKFSQVENRTQLLREKSIRLQEMRYARTTHSAIVGMIEKRGLGLCDPPASSEIME